MRWVVVGVCEPVVVHLSSFAEGVIVVGDVSMEPCSIILTGSHVVVVRAVVSKVAGVAFK